jgi:hypothetical protein
MSMRIGVLRFRYSTTEFNSGFGHKISAPSVPAINEARKMAILAAA